MLRPRHNRLRFLAGLAGIGIVYTFYCLYLLGQSWFIDGLSRPDRHWIKFATVLLAYGFGAYGFAGACPRWMYPLWNILFAFLLPVLVILGLLDTWGKVFSIPARDAGMALHELSISPVPYIIVAIIGRAARRGGGGAGAAASRREDEGRGTGLF